MQKAKLLKLAAFLRTVKPRRFNLKNWASKADFAKHECGSTACGLGFATVCFPRSNLRLRTDQSYDKSDMTVLEYITKDAIYKDWDAAQAFFNINNEQAQYLFWEDSYKVGRRGPKSVAKRIEDFVANAGKIPQS